MHQYYKVYFQGIINIYPIKRILHKETLKTALLVYKYSSKNAHCE